MATLGAREDEIKAAQAALEMAKQRLIQTKNQLSDAAPKAPATSYVENTFYRPGEYVPAGKAVVSLLPPENIKVRFFVSQKILPTISQGKKSLSGVMDVINQSKLKSASSLPRLNIHLRDL